MLKAGSIIKALRERFGYGQDVIAQFLGIKREIVSYYETGSREVPLEVLERLSDLFGVDLAVFLVDDLEEVKADLAFAFRAEQLNESDLDGIAAFRRIIKNYERIKNLEQNNA